MSITLVNTAKTETIAGETTPNFPAGVAENDFLALCIGVKDGTRTVTAGLESWTLISQFLSSTGTSSSAFLYVKRAGASEAAPTIAFSSINANAINISAWRGVDTTTAQDVAFGSASQSFNSTVSAPSLTTVTDGALYLTHMVWDDGVDDAPATTSTAGLTQLFNADAGDVGAISHYKEVVTAGASGSVSYSITGSESLAAISIALRPGAASSTPTITDVDGDESVYPGQSYIIAATDDIGATTGTVFWERLDGTDSVEHTVTGWDAATDQITVTAVRGTHNYGTGLYRVRVVLGDGTTEILFDNGGAGLSLEAQPGTFAVTAASPNTTDDASLWTGLIDTATSNPITIVDGDQAFVKNPNNLTNLAVAPDGTVTADTTGDFMVQIWLASEEVWGSDQTVTFSEPDIVGPTVSSVTVPTAGTYAVGDNLDFTVNMNEVSFVTGTPALGVMIGGSARQANYVSGDGTQALLFRYPVQSGDEDTDGIEVTGLTLDGGTIKDAAGNDATLTLNSVGSTTGVLVDGVSPLISINPLTTLDTTPIASGNAGDATSITLDVEGVDVTHSSTYIPTISSGIWAQQLNELALGTYTMTATGVDDAGNETVVSATLKVVEQIATSPRGLFQPLFRSLTGSVNQTLFR